MGERRSSKRSGERALWGGELLPQDLGREHLVLTSEDQGKCSRCQTRWYLTNAVLFSRLILLVEGLEEQSHRQHLQISVLLPRVPDLREMLHCIDHKYILPFTSYFPLPVRRPPSGSLSAIRLAAWRLSRALDFQGPDSTTECWHRHLHPRRVFFSSSTTSSIQRLSLLNHLHFLSRHNGRSQEP